MELKVWEAKTTASNPSHVREYISVRNHTYIETSERIYKSSKKKKRSNKNREFDTNYRQGPQSKRISLGQK